jgi:hypothetical protein
MVCITLRSLVQTIDSDHEQQLSSQAKIDSISAASTTNRVDPPMRRTAQTRSRTFARVQEISPSSRSSASTLCVYTLSTMPRTTTDACHCWRPLVYTWRSTSTRQTTLSTGRILQARTTMSTFRVCLQRSMRSQNTTTHFCSSLAMRYVSGVSSDREMRD